MQSGVKYSAVPRRTDVCVWSHLTSYCAAPGDDLPQHKSHGVNVGLFERLNVFQVDSGLQDLRGHVPGSAHLRTDRVKKDSPLEPRTPRGGCSAGSASCAIVPTSYSVCLNQNTLDVENNWKKKKATWPRAQQHVSCLHSNYHIGNYVHRCFPPMRYGLFNALGV